MKNFIGIILVLATIFAAGCGRKSSELSRGIGLYPGLWSESGAPEMIAEPTNNFRNLAEYKTAYANDSYDYNLTAQLLTDGIVAQEEPKYLEVFTSGGELPRREREWTLDRGPYSNNVLVGDSVFIQYNLRNYKKSANCIDIYGYVAFYEDLARGGGNICVEISNDGDVWQKVGELKSKGLLGNESKRTVSSDPNKQTDADRLPIRMLREQISLQGDTDFNFIRLKFNMRGAAYWTLYDIDFRQDTEYVNLLPSHHFVSCWMASARQKNNLLVDLQSVCSADSLVLHWVYAPESISVKFSSDSLNWREQKYNVTEDIQKIWLGDKVRYVKIDINEDANKQYVALSEIKVMGCGGLVAKNRTFAKVNNNRYDLSGGNWRIQRNSDDINNGLQVSSATFDDGNWLAATVPGTALVSYLNAQAIPNPNYDENMLQISESFFNEDFWYRNVFDMPENFERNKYLLNFDGINWKAEVFLNEKYIGRIDGAFTRAQFDITSVVKREGNVLAVHIFKNENIGAVKEKYYKNTDFNGGLLGADNPTFHATIGWDWISTIRGRNIGIYNDVYLTAVENIVLHDPKIETVLADNDTAATIRPSVRIRNLSDDKIKVSVEFQLANYIKEKISDVEIEASDVKNVEFDVKNFPSLIGNRIPLWWPNGYGNPTLHKAMFIVSYDNKNIDTLHFDVGLREVKSVIDDGALVLYVNHKRFVPRGGNWGFAEHNLLYRKREYDVAVAYHKDMNFNCIRNWVGQVPDDELYDACNRYGVMIWQDFWLANPSDGPDPKNNEMFLQNADDYICRIRQHPSVLLYCGRNEGFPPEVLDTALRTLVKKNHGLPYISSSADDVVSGHGPYRALSAKDYFSLPNGNTTIHTERGMPNVMNYESVVRTLSSEHLTPILSDKNNVYGQHDFTTEGAQYGQTFRTLMYQYADSISLLDPKTFFRIAQIVNYEGYRAMFESRSLNRKGLLLWMSHAAWPSFTWQTYDYYFEPTGGYFGCKKGSEPLHVQYNAATNKIEVVNYSDYSSDVLNVNSEIINLSGDVLYSSSDVVQNTSDHTTIISDVPTDTLQTRILRLVLRKGDLLVSENTYLLPSATSAKEIASMARANVSCTLGEAISHADGTISHDITLTNNAKTPALFVRINLLEDGKQILPVLYSDNYITLMPSEEKKLSLRYHSRDKHTAGKARVEVSAVN